jgi:hypothetical protein
VGLALHACLGGSAPGFHVSQISHQVFKFALSCKQVGLFVYSLKSYSYDKFMVRFDLWRDGGANYRREFARWNRECLAEWTTVSILVDLVPPTVSLWLINSSKTLHKSSTSLAISLLNLGSSVVLWISRLPKRIWFSCC